MCCVREETPVVKSFGSKQVYRKCESGLACGRGAEASWLVNTKEEGEGIVCDQCLVTMHLGFELISRMPLVALSNKEDYYARTSK